MVLTLNTFEVHGEHYLQIGGTVMGTHAASKCAFTMLKNEETHVYTYQLLLWVHYINDIFTMWSFEYTCEHSTTRTYINNKPEIRSKTINIQTQIPQKNNLPSEFQITDGPPVNVRPESGSPLWPHSLSSAKQEMFLPIVNFQLHGNLYFPFTPFFLWWPSNLKYYLDPKLDATDTCKMRYWCSSRAYSSTYNVSRNSFNYHIYA